MKISWERERESFPWPSNKHHHLTRWQTFFVLSLFDIGFTAGERARCRVFRCCRCWPRPAIFYIYRNRTRDVSRMAGENATVGHFPFVELFGFIKPFFASPAQRHPTSDPVLQSIKSRLKYIYTVLCWQLQLITTKHLALRDGSTWCYMTSSYFHLLAVGVSHFWLILSYRNTLFFFLFKKTEQSEKQFGHFLTK